MGVDPDRDQVHAVGPEGTAAQQAPGAQGRGRARSRARECLHRVGGAARVEATGRNPARGRTLIGGDQGDRHPHGEALAGPAPLMRSPGSGPGRPCSEARRHVLAERGGGQRGRGRLEPHQVGPPGQGRRRGCGRRRGLGAGANSARRHRRSGAQLRMPPGETRRGPRSRPGRTSPAPGRWPHGPVSVAARRTPRGG